MIGIDSAIQSPTGYGAGSGFAVTVNLARSVMSQREHGGRVERAALGVLVRDATTEDAAYAGMAANRECARVGLLCGRLAGKARRPVAWLAHGAGEMKRLLSAPHVRLRMMPGFDHTFSRAWMRRRLDEELLGILEGV